ncbi:MAG: hypothetical protein WCS51_04075 [Bacilli bacterium]
MNIRGSSRGSYYQSGKNWAAKKLRNIPEDKKSKLIELFEYYKSPISIRTKTGKILTYSKKQFYYGAAKYLKDHRSCVQVKLFR